MYFPYLTKNQIIKKIKGLRLHRKKIILKEGYKICSRCSNEKLLEEFSKRKNYLKSHCKQCIKEKYLKDYQLNPEKFRERGRINQRNYIKNNYIKYKEYQNTWKKQYYSIQYRNNPKYRITRLLRGRLIKLIRKNQKSNTTLKLLDCTLEFFKSYLESKFTINMSWEKLNQGLIHIDHIRPCSSFDLSDPEQQKICFHYTNLQPLWATTKIARVNGDFNSIGNLNKGDKII